MEQERLAVLKLVESGAITAEQGVRLLNALQPPAAVAAPAGPAALVEQPRRAALRTCAVAAAGAQGRPRWLRLRVIDARGRSKVDLQFPLAVLGVALRLGGRWLPELRQLDPNAIVAALQLGSGGRLFAADDGLEGERIELTLE